MSEDYSIGYARGYEAGQQSILKLAEQPAQHEPKLPEFFARLEYDTPGWDVVVSVYQRREDATPVLVHREPLPNQQPAQQEPLTDEYIERIYHRYGGDMINCARAIERAAQRTWVGLVWGELPEDGQNHDFLRGAVWAETKLKEKNA